MLQALHGNNSNNNTNCCSRIYDSRMPASSTATHTSATHIHTHAELHQAHAVDASVDVGASSSQRAPQRPQNADSAGDAGMQLQQQKQQQQ